MSKKNLYERGSQMAIFVCIKQVPDTETKIQVKEDNSGIKTDSIKWVMNPYDEFAVEEAIKLKSATGSEKVYAVTLGPQKRVQDSLRIALAMGCDEGIVIDSEESLDSLTSAKAIKSAISKTGEPKLILTGKSSIDDNSQAFTQQLAALFEAPHATAITKVNADGDKVEVEREVEGGAKEIYEIHGLCVLGANKGLNNPRYPSLPGIMKAKKKPVHNFSLADLEVSSDSNVLYEDYQLPAPQPPTKILSGEIDQQVSELVTLLKDEAKVL
jgi:electron transfer flavoprotein beta subunit